MKRRRICLIIVTPQGEEEFQRLLDWLTQHANTGGNHGPLSQNRN